MQRNELKLGVLVTTRNDGVIIRNCLNSVYNQDYTNMVIVCIDDGSDVDIDEVLDFEYDRTRLIIKKIQHSERAVSREVGLAILREIKVDYFVFIDSDMTMPAGFITSLMKFTLRNNADGVILQEEAISSYKNYWSRVKVFERNLYSVDCKTLNRSIEAARLWNLGVFPNFEEGLLAFEEIQPTIKGIAQGLKIIRTDNLYIFHDEKYVDFKNLVNKKTKYFSSMSTHEKVSLGSMISRFYFFRPQLYNKVNIKKYVKNPALFMGVMILYTALTIVALKEYIKGSGLKIKQ